MTKLYKTPGTTPEDQSRMELPSTTGGGADGNDLGGDIDVYCEQQINPVSMGTSDNLTGQNAGVVDKMLTPRLLGGTPTTAAVQLSSRNEDGGVNAEGQKGVLMRGEEGSGRLHAVAPEAVVEAIDASAAASALAVTGVFKPTTALVQGIRNSSTLRASNVTVSSTAVDVGASTGRKKKKSGWNRGGRRRRRGKSDGSNTDGGNSEQEGRSQKGGLEGSKMSESSAGGVGNDELEARVEEEMNEEEIGVFGRDDVVANGQAEDVEEEDDEGNVEYKLKLVNPPLDRLEHLFTQMNWRLNEGRGECVYMVGYEDDGKATGISPSDLSASIKTLKVMMKAVGAKISKMEMQAGAGGGKLRVARVTVVRQAAVLDGLPAGSASRGLRVGVLGHAGAGKSTLVGVLTRGLSDNGRGLARMQVFRHNHEVFNGQTSSISQQALTLPLARRESAARNGRRSAGGSGGGSSSPNHRRKHGMELGGEGEVSRDAEAIRLSSSLPRSTRLGGASSSNGFASAWARGRRRGESLDESGRRVPRWAGSGLASAAADEEEESRVLTFIDQPGHEKYLKTTLTGMTGSALDYAMLVVSGVAGVQRMTREHLAIALALQLPLFLVMTKTDVAGTMPRGMSPTRTPPPQPAAAALLPSTAIELALQGIDRVLWSCMGKRAKIVEGVEDAEIAADAIRGGSGAAGTSWDGFVPVIQVSSVTADGFTELRAFLGRLAPPEPLEAMYKEARGKAAEVRISNVFMVEGVGEVYAGTVVSGTVSVGDRLLLGPTGPRGSFVRTAVASVHISRLAVRSASAGQTAAFTLVSVPDADGDGDDSELDSAPDPPTLAPTVSQATTPTFTPRNFEESQDEGDVAIPRSAGNNTRTCLRNGSGLFGGGWSTSGGGLVGGKGNDGHGGGVETSRSGGPPTLVLGEASLASGSMGNGVDTRMATSGKDGDCGVSVGRPCPLLVESGVAVGEGESPGRRLRKGMVLVEATSRPNTTYEFEAEVMILHHPRVIRENYQPVVHAHNICQSACIISMVRSSPANSVTSNEMEDTGSAGIKSGERAICRFRFLYRPEYLSAGTTIVLREGRTRGFGKVISVE